MSAIAGIYHADNSPVDREVLERMRDIVDYRGPDGSGIWVNGKVGLAHRLLWDTEESIHEKQPMTNGYGLWITADARIDNRDELERKFRSGGIWAEIERLFDPLYPPDSAFILLAYQLWGVEAPDYLLGDFSFALWDSLNRRLFCARDQVGIRPFVYSWDGRRFIFGSEMKQIFQDPSVPRNVNRNHLADILLMSFQNRDQTPYQAIHRLPPSHSILIEGGRLKITRYWNWSPDCEPRSQSSTMENAEKLLHLLNESVRARLRVPFGYHVGSHLSGGLDSSSLVSIAASLRNSASHQRSGFPVFTLHFPEANPAYQFKHFDAVDESFYSQALIQKYGLEAHRIEIKGWGPLENLVENLWYQENPIPYSNLAYFDFLYKEASRSRVRAIFAGDGGDELFWIGPRCLIHELLEKGRVVTFFREWFALRKKFGGSISALLLSIFWNFLPEAFKIPYRFFFQKPVPSWIDPQFAEKTGLKERMVKERQWHLSRLGSSSYDIMVRLESDMFIIGHGAGQRAASRYFIDLRVPFLDLRLLRFAASLPRNQKIQRGVNKFLLREALKDVLPPQILQRYGKTEFTPVIWSGLERYASLAIKEMLEHPHPLLGSMVTLKEVKRIYQRAFSARASGISLDRIRSQRDLWHMLTVDLWLKHQESIAGKPKEVLYERQKEFVAA